MNFRRGDKVANFFKESDLVIIIDDDYCPADKDLNFTFLNENIVAKIANDLEMVDSEYNDMTIGEIENLLRQKEIDLDSYFKMHEPEEFNHAVVERVHPKDIPAESICGKINEDRGVRNFVVLDQFLDRKQSLDLLKGYLEALHRKFEDCYIGIVFWSSKPCDIKTLEDAKKYLINDVRLREEVAEELSMYVNFIDKNSDNYSHDFEVAFRKSQNNNLISLFSKSYKASVNSLKSRMWDINNNEELIHYDYLMEGMQLDDIFFEIIQASFKRAYTTYSKDDYDRYINPIRKAVQKYENEICKPDEPEKIEERIFISRSVKELNNLMKNDNFIQDCKKSDDLRFGDVFKINDKHYMVVTQGCDLSIRMSEGRKKDYIDLIQIIVSEEKSKNKKIQNKLKPIGGTQINSGNYQNFIRKNLDRFASIGIKEHDMLQILNNPSGEDLDVKIHTVELDNTNTKFYSVESIFLDCIILFAENDSIEITKDTIEKSKEIRIATKRYIEDKLCELIDKYSGLNKEVLTRLADLDKKYIATLVPFQFKFNEEDKLIGLSIESSQFSRVGRLDYIKAHEIFKEFMNKYSRYEYNNPPLIE